MIHLGSFFAGTSLGLFVGVLLTSLAKISDLAREQELLPSERVASQPKLTIIRR
jgi:hypothetical protein